MKDTDYNIVGLVHYYGTVPNQPKCSQVRPADGILPKAALIYAVSRVNRLRQIASRLKLGLRIFDICDEKEIQFTVIKIIFTPKLVGVIGTSHPNDVTVLGVSMNLFLTPVLNFNEVPLDIDYRQRFDTFYWLSPYISYLTHALIEFASDMRWNYIGLIYQKSKYGWTVNEELKTMAKNHSICFSNTLKIDSGWKSDDIVHTLLFEFLPITRAKVVVLALEEVELIELLEALKKMPEEAYSEIQFLSLSRWGTKQIVVKGYEKQARGIITFQPMYKEEKNFIAYYNSKNFSSLSFVTNYTKSLKNTISGRDVTRVHLNEEAFGDVRYSNAAAYIESVYALAFVLSEILKNNSNASLLKARGKKRTNAMLASLRNTKNTYPFRKDILNFESNRRVQPVIGIYNYQELSKDVYTYVQVGSWTYGCVHSYNTRPSINYFANATRIQWQPRESQGRPSSTCSAPCKENEITIMIPQFEACCWECIECDENQFTRNNTCVQCQQGERANHELGACVELLHQRARAPRAIEIIIYVQTAVSTALTFAALVVLIRFRDEQLIKASSRELTLTIFVGLILWNTVPIFMETEITKPVCFIRGLFLYLGYSLVYASLLLKTNRIYRIFQSGKLGPKLPKAVSPLSQVLITVCVCFVQITICLVRVTNLEVKYLYPEDREIVIEYCADDIIVFFTNLVYILSIMAATTFFAFKTRHFPKNYNESKYIGIVMYITCFVSCIGLVCYFALSDHGYRSAIASLVCLLCSNTVLLCLFGNKFTILFKAKYENKTPGTKQANDDTPGTPTTTTTTTTENGKIGPDTESPNMWDSRRNSGVSMLSILRMPRTTKTHNLK